MSFSVSAFSIRASVQTDAPEEKKDPVKTSNEIYEKAKVKSSECIQETKIVVNASWDLSTLGHRIIVIDKAIHTIQGFLDLIESSGQEISGITKAIDTIKFYQQLNDFSDRKSHFQWELNFRKMS